MCCFCSCKSVQVFELCAVIATGSSFEAASCSILFLIARMGAAQSSDGGSQPGTTAKAAAAMPPIQLSLQLPPYLFQAAVPQGTGQGTPPLPPPPSYPGVPPPLPPPQFPPAEGFPPQAPAGTVSSVPMPGPSMGMALGPSMGKGRVWACQGRVWACQGRVWACQGQPWGGACRAEYGRDARAGRRAAAVQPVRAADVLEGVDLPQ